MNTSPTRQMQRSSVLQRLRGPGSSLLLCMRSEGSGNRPLSYYCKVQILLHDSGCRHKDFRKRHVFWLCVLSRRIKIDAYLELCGANSDTLSSIAIFTAKSLKSLRLLSSLLTEPCRGGCNRVIRRDLGSLYETRTGRDGKD